MKGKIVNVKQRSDEWFGLRMGLITASKIGRCFTSKLALSKAGIISVGNDLTAESTGIHKPFFMNEHMQWGIDQEPCAIMDFRITHGNDYDEIVEDTFFVNKELNVGASPDLYTLAKGKVSGVEIKCPMLKNHVKYAISGVCPAKYYPQVQFSMALTGAQEWVFGSYHPESGLSTVMVQRDDVFQGRLREVVDTLNYYIDQSLGG